MTIDRQTMEVDIACVGFGPATAGFMHTLSQAMTAADGSVLLESKVMPGMPLQVVCYERADDLAELYEACFDHPLTWRRPHERQE